jgi:transposase
LAARRRLAVARVREGCGPQEVADFLGVHVSSVCRWVDRFERDGDAGLEAAPVPGRPPKLTARQAERMVSWVRDKSPQDFGFLSGHWTASRVAAVARRQLGVSFNHRYLNDWLSRHGISPQIPDRVPRERDEAVIGHWKRYVWPYIKGGPTRRGRC